jgi:phospholipid/cholesterol/gamma-HCH transport system substrate-binding protein
MRSLSNEFLVGLLTIVVAVLVAWGFARTDDVPDGADTAGYTLYYYLDSAEGLFRSTPVRLAGVPVGAVEKIELEGQRAKVTLQMVGEAKLPVDSVGELKGEGILGDKFIRVRLGTADTYLKDGDTLQSATSGADMDEMTAKASAIADDVKEITGALREVLADPAMREQLKSTITNIDALTRELNAAAGENREELAVIAQNLREVSEILSQVVQATGASVEQEMAAVRKATETLDRTAQNLESITGKVDRGEGTVGKLLNDESTIESINHTIDSVSDTVDEVNGLVGSVSRIRTDVYYRGDYFFGSAPTDAAYGGENPVAGGARNVVGVRIRPKEDYWYVVEVVGHPLGTITHEDHVLPDFGTAYREYVVTPDYRFSFQFAKRWHDLVLRFGVKESSGGVGADLLFFRDRAQLSADVFDFTYAAWPNMDASGIPNLQLTARAYPFKNVYLEGGMDNVVLGARYGYVTGFAGGGFTFDDQDLKYVLAALPLP